jgi:hypothetical protein
MNQVIAMTDLRTLSFFFALLLVLAPPECGTAQQRMNMTETKSAAPYHPGLGELMPLLCSRATSSLASPVMSGIGLMLLMSWAN